MAVSSFHSTDLSGAYVIDDFYVGDNRGGVTKCFEKDVYLENGIEFRLNESFISRSQKNVIRGLHFQLKNPQAKLVTVLNGRVQDYIVDLRPDSSTYKNWICVELSAYNHKSLYVPRGFAHRFVSMEDNTLMLYQCNGKNDYETDTGIRYDDPDIGIEWPIDESVAIHSERDLRLPSFNEYLRKPMDLQNIRGGISRQCNIILSCFYNKVYYREAA